MNTFIRALVAGEHSEKQWRDGWDGIREQTVAGPLHIEFVSIDDEKIVLRMPITNAARQPYGLLHGGVSMVLAETAASSHACWKHDVNNTIPVGIEINGSHLDSAREGHVVATGRVIRRGKRLVVHEITLVHEETGKTLNISRVTNMYIPTPGA